jgi:hypothetical protein
MRGGAMRTTTSKATALKIRPPAKTNPINRFTITHTPFLAAKLPTNPTTRITLHVRGRIETG